MKIILLALILAACSSESSNNENNANSSNNDAAVNNVLDSGENNVNNSPDGGETQDMIGSADVSSDSSGSDLAQDMGPYPEGCYDYRQFVAQNVSYQNDVMPIFAQRCSGCHSNPNRSAYYGDGTTDAAIATAVRDKLLNETPIQAPNLRFVVPGDPLRSYMIAKVEYDDPGGTCALVQCSEPGCNLQAPPSAQLPEPELVILRSWVINGALDN